MAAKASGNVAIIGSGLIGKSWAMLFTSASYKVAIYDVKPELVKAALTSIQEQLTSLEASGQLRGDLSASQQYELIRPAQSVSDCVQGAMYVQECVPEVLHLKKNVFEELDAAAEEDTILASSTSAIPCSKFTELLKGRARCIVAHPINPPYLMPLVEVVPAPWTAAEVAQRTKVLMDSLGQSPVLLKKEVPGFLQPRIQYAVIQEALRLVQDDAISVEDIDKVMTYGLGVRYSFMGPLETAHLNAEGFANYSERYQDMIHGISKDSGPPVAMDPKSETMKKIHSQLCQAIPLAELDARRKWRDEGVARLAQLKRDMD